MRTLAVGIAVVSSLHSRRSDHVYEVLDGSGSDEQDRRPDIRDACHEGNHAMTGILAGARAEEKAAAEAANKKP